MQPKYEVLFLQFYAISRKGTRIGIVRVSYLERKVEGL